MFFFFNGKSSLSLGLNECLSEWPLTRNVFWVPWYLTRSQFNSVCAFLPVSPGGIEEEEEPILDIYSKNCAIRHAWFIKNHQLIHSCLHIGRVQSVGSRDAKRENTVKKEDFRFFVCSLHSTHCWKDFFYLFFIKITEQEWKSTKDNEKEVPNRFSREVSPAQKISLFHLLNCSLIHKSFHTRFYRVKRQQKLDLCQKKKLWLCFRALQNEPVKCLIPLPSTLIYMPALPLRNASELLSFVRSISSALLQQCSTSDDCLTLVYRSPHCKSHSQWAAVSVLKKTLSTESFKKSRVDGVRMLSESWRFLEFVLNFN